MSSSPMLRLHSDAGLPLPPVGLGEPVLAYAAPASSASGALIWSATGPDRWQCTDGAARLAMSLTRSEWPPAGDWAELRLSVTALQPIALRHAAIEVCFPCDAPPLAIDDELRWRRVSSDLLLKAWTPLAARWRHEGAATELRSLRGAVCMRLSWRRPYLRALVYLDAAMLHPRWSFATRAHVSTAAPERPAGHCMDVTLYLRALALDTLDPPAVAGRFPGGAEAAFTITDHCDFDSNDRLRVFLDGTGRERGWIGRGLRLTKGVFTLPSTPPHPRVPVPSLADAEYRALVCRLHDEGSEIAPHGVNESGNIPPDAFRAALARIARDFAPGVWIDHGLTLRYCYTMDGADHLEYDLLGELWRHGIMTLWSYDDLPANPVGSLNMLAPAKRDAAAMTMRMGQHLGIGAPLVAAHYLRSLLRTRVKGRVGQAVLGMLISLRHSYMSRVLATEQARGLSPAAALHAVRSLSSARRSARPTRRGAAKHYTRGEALDMAGIIYPERAVPITNVAPDDFLLFQTMEVLHTRDVYTPRAIDRLVRERGVHIGHCYLLNQLPYIAGLFEPGRGAVRLSRAWLNALDGIGGAVATGRLWNPPVSELAAWVRARQLAAVVPVGDAAIEIANPLASPIDAFTVLLPPTIAEGSVRWGDGAPAGSRRWNDWLAVWGPVPAEGAALVQWR